MVEKVGIGPFRLAEREDWRETQRERESKRERGREREMGGAVYSTSLVQKEEVPRCWQESWLNLSFDCVVVCPFICLIAKRSTLH